MTTLNNIASTIDHNNWAFSVVMTEPKYKTLAVKKHKVGDTLAYITDLINQNGATEIQITPMRKNGTSYKTNIAKTITLKTSNHSMQAIEQPPTQQPYTGLGSPGLGFAEMTDLMSIKRDHPKLERENDELKRENKELKEKNQELEKKLLKFELKAEQGGVSDLLKDPTVLTSILGMLKPKVTPALAGASPVASPVAELKPSVKAIVGYLNIEDNEQARQFIYKIVSMLQDKDVAPKMLPEIIDIINKYDIN